MREVTVSTQIRLQDGRDFWITVEDNDIDINFPGLTISYWENNNSREERVRYVTMDLELIPELIKALQALNPVRTFNPQHQAKIELYNQENNMRKHTTHSLTDEMIEQIQDQDNTHSDDLRAVYDLAIEHMSQWIQENGHEYVVYDPKYGRKTFFIQMITDFKQGFSPSKAMQSQKENN